MTFRYGITGNYYVISERREKLEELCLKIGKAKSSVYWNKKYQVFAVRVKNKKTKILLKNFFQ